MKVEDIKVEFKDLSIPLKIGIVLSWFIGIIYGIAFITGIIIGMMGVA